MELPNRKPTRLKNYDYSSNGIYFVTICTQNKKRIFKIDPVGNGLCAVPPLQNQIIHKWIKETENKFKNIKISKYVIMPNHLHLLIEITERHTGRSLQDAMHFFKTMTTNDYIKNVKNNSLPAFDKKLWQKSYYDHIIRDEDDYLIRWNYIDTNPQRWEKDELYAE